MATTTFSGFYQPSPTRAGEAHQHHQQGAQCNGLDDLARVVARVVRERVVLSRPVAILDAKLIEVTDLLERGDAVPAAHHRSYYAGHAGKRRNAPAADAPEWRARRLRQEAKAA